MFMPHNIHNHNTKLSIIMQISDLLTLNMVGGLPNPPGLFPASSCQTGAHISWA
jgi:hypothetical protein